MKNLRLIEQYDLESEQISNLQFVGLLLLTPLTFILLVFFKVTALITRLFNL